MSSRPAPDTAGFIGLGMMGLSMAYHLARAVREVRVFDIREAAMSAALVQPGVRAAASPGEIAASCAMVFTCLPSLEAIREVYMAREGLVHGARRGQIVCELSTTNPELSAEIAQQLERRGAAYLEAMIIGQPPAAAARELFFIVGGDEATAARVLPALQAMGRGFRRVGGVGSASRAKLLHNALGMMHAGAACEVVALCLKVGIDVDAFIEIVRESPKSRGIGYSSVFDWFAADIAHGRGSGAGKLYIAAKDMELARSLAASAELPTPLLDEAAAMFSEALGAGWGEREFTFVARVIERRTGRTIFAPPGGTADSSAVKDDRRGA